MIYRSENLRIYTLPIHGIAAFKIGLDASGPVRIVCNEEENKCIYRKLPATHALGRQILCASASASIGRINTWPM